MKGRCLVAVAVLSLALLALPPTRAVRRIYGSQHPSTDDDNAIGALNAKRPANALAASALPNTGYDLTTALPANLHAYAGHRVSLLRLVAALRAHYDDTKATQYAHVVVVGGGPVGMMAGLHAYARGSAVRVVEARDAFARFNLLGMRKQVQETWARMWASIIDEAAAAGLKVDGHAVVKAEWEAEVQWFFEAFLGEAEGRSLPILSFEEVLHALLSKLDTNFAYVKKAKMVHLASWIDGQPTVDLVVAADGLWSGVRADLFGDAVVAYARDGEVPKATTTGAKRVKSVADLESSIGVYLSLFTRRSRAANNGQRLFDLSRNHDCGLVTQTPQFGGGVEQVMGVITDRSIVTLEKLHAMVDAVNAARKSAAGNSPLDAQDDTVALGACKRDDVLALLHKASGASQTQHATWLREWKTDLEILATPAFHSAEVATKMWRCVCSEENKVRLTYLMDRTATHCTQCAYVPVLLLGDSAVAPFFPKGTGLRNVFAPDSQFARYVNVLRDRAKLSEYKVGEAWLGGIKESTGVAETDKLDDALAIQCKAAQVRQLRNKITNQL